MNIPVKDADYSSSNFLPLSLGWCAKSWKLATIGAILGGALGWAVLSINGPLYSVSASIRMGQQVRVAPGGGYSPMEIETPAAMAGILHNPDWYSTEVIKSCNAGRDDLAALVVTNIDGPSLILSVRGRDPETAVYCIRELVQSVIDFQNSKIGPKVSSLKEELARMNASRQMDQRRLPSVAKVSSGSVAEYLILRDEILYASKKIDEIKMLIGLYEQAQLNFPIPDSAKLIYPRRPSATVLVGILMGALFGVFVSFLKHR